MPIILGILIFGLIVLIHELGHFLSARMCKINVEEFAIGMGPKLLSYKIKETIYSLRIFPIGGFCLLTGEDKESKSPFSFGNKSIAQRFFVICSGVFMNLILAFVFFFILNLFSGATFRKVNKILKNSPAHESGIVSGDVINKIDNNKINISQDLNFYINDTNGKEIVVNIIRKNKFLDFKLKPIKSEYGGYYIGVERYHKIGIFDNDKNYERINIIESLVLAYHNVFFYIKISLIGLSRLFVGRIAFKELAGPIGIIQVIGETYSESIKKSFFYTLQTLLNFTAIISANVGIFNLLPIPALDGGKLIFLSIEFFRRKKINPSCENLVHLIGFSVLIIFAIIIAISDVIKIF
ncbi:MAG: M50 family metallopeptidase [Clostridiales bacterium]|jgi:regulator of sigma E protease|nr:M50 family metallopeptidase [Clostridiales bacterium]